MASVSDMIARHCLLAVNIAVMGFHPPGAGASHLKAALLTLSSAQIGCVSCADRIAARNPNPSCRCRRHVPGAMALGWSCSKLGIGLLDHGAWLRDFNSRPGPSDGGSVFTN